eukprot:7538540-Pyramimonas_sp.AAC.1
MHHGCAPEAILNHHQVSGTILEATLGSLRPSWNHLGAILGHLGRFNYPRHPPRPDREGVGEGINPPTRPQS